MARSHHPAHLASLVGLSLAACFYPADRARLLEQKVERLAQENAALERKLATTDVKISGTIPQVEEKLQQMNKALQGLDKAARRTDADIGVQLQKSIEDAQQLRGQVETYLHRIDALEQGLKQLEETTEKRLVELKGEHATREADAQRRAEDIKRPAAPKDFLELADAKAKAGDASLAQQLYLEFLKKWPKHDLVPQGELGLAEAYFAQNKCEDALTHYGIVLKEYAKSSGVPKALLHASECFTKLKMSDAARDALDELVKNHPKSDSAKVAKARLADMDKSKPKKKK